jgi:hypothetical protein
VAELTVDDVRLEVVDLSEPWSPSPEWQERYALACDLKVAARQLDVPPSI